MGLIKVIAYFACDECGRHMIAELEADYVSPTNQAIFDIAEDFLHGGRDDGSVGMGMTSVQDGKHLCIVCTKEADDDKAITVQDSPVSGVVQQLRVRQPSRSVLGKGATWTPTN